MKPKQLVTTAFAALSLTLLQAQTVLAADGGEVQSKVNQAANTIKGVLTGILVIVGICVALFIIIKRLPSADDPREKSEVYHAVGRVAGLVALGAAIVWLLPWVYSLFQ